MISAVQSVGLAHAPDAVATVGLIEAQPNSRNVIPGDVFFSIDLRHPDDTTVAAMEADLRTALKDAAGPAVTFVFDRIWDSPAVHFDVDCVASVERAAAAIGYSSRRITSGAGHDAAYVARVAPTTMIFVPCAKGISHNELEKAEKSDVTAGANVLLAAVLDTDARLYGSTDR
jgi:N-carbamoyl-L-amino-acid hydrolase